jgi:LCP family protein required for cell wall assembly
MKTALKFFGGVLIAGLILGVLGFGVWQFRRLFSKPLAEPLAIQMDSQQETTEVSETISFVIEATNVPQPAQTPQGLCGNTGSIQILMAGADYSLGMPPYGADAIRLTKIDFDNASMTTVAFPRALIVNSGALGDPLKSQMELGTSYYEKRQTAQGSNNEKASAGSMLLAQVLYDNFEVIPNHYMTLQLDSIGAMIDQVGGIEITLTTEITTEHGVTFPAGTQTLNGRLAAEFVRAKQPGGEAARLQRQNQFIKALQKKLFSANSLTKISELLKQFEGAIVTDLSPEQILTLACAYEQIPDESEKFYNLIGQEYVTTTEDGQMLPKVEEIKAFLRQTMTP